MTGADDGWDRRIGPAAARLMLRAQRATVVCVLLLVAAAIVLWAGRGASGRDILGLVVPGALVALAVVVAVWEDRTMRAARIRAAEHLGCGPEPLPRALLTNRAGFDAMAEREVARRAAARAVRPPDDPPAAES